MSDSSFLLWLLSVGIYLPYHFLCSFDLSKPISIKEAIFALDYIDHDFYVFRDEESNDVNVVYKRNAGGVGLIQPEKWSITRSNLFLRASGV